MKQMLIVIKETYLRQVKSWSFFLMVLSPFLFIGLTIGINYFVGSSTSAKSNIALITDQAPVKEGLKGTDGLTFDYKDEAAAKKAMKEEEIKGILTVEEKDGQLEACLLYTSCMSAKSMWVKKKPVKSSVEHQMCAQASR